jgi:POT family proton-dependent oligopeptide transporter
MFNKHPKGLIVLALANMGERFGYYTMLAILVLFMQAKFGLNSGQAGLVYSVFLALVYFLPLFGGILADKVLGYGKTILIGVVIMFAGYLFLSIPTANNTTGMFIMFGALALIAIGTGCFKGNLQALVGNLYDDPRYSKYRDIAFSIFYMFINVGAFFAPSMANYINNTILAKDNYSYDAAIPTNYNKLNDKVVDEKTFTINAYKQCDKTLATKDDSTKYLNAQKKKQSVIFQNDYDAAIFKIKTAALVQTKVISKSQYDIINDIHTKDTDPQKAALLSTIKTTQQVKNVDLSSNKAVYSWAQKYVGQSLATSYNMSFAVSCFSLVLSLLIFLIFKKTWKPVDKTLKQQLAEEKEKPNTATKIVKLTKAQTKERMIALFLVFFVVIFFWMAFHQNGCCLTYFARDYVNSNVVGGEMMAFNLLALLSFIVFAYGIYTLSFGLFGSKRSAKGGIITTIIGLGCLIGVYLTKVYNAEIMKITPQIFQQFNPFFIILLTPLSVAIFSALNSKGKEPSAPRKIGMGMFVAGCGFIVMLFAALTNHLPAPNEIQGVSNTLVSPNWLIGTYFTLTIAELLLSPMGLSFVAKVAPPQYKGMMQGGWLAATAIGNLLVGVMASFWEKIPMAAFWSVMVICCVLSGIFIFSVIKKLDRATADEEEPKEEK